MNRFYFRAWLLNVETPRVGVALCLALTLAVGVFAPQSALAHKNGEPTQGCTGCHKGGKVPTVSISADRLMVAPGETIDLTVNVSQTNGPAAGFYLLSSGVGSFVISDPGTRLQGSGVTHSAPRVGGGGSTTFHVGWVAPTMPGGVDFYVWANSANGDGTPQGDGEGTAFYSTAFGCAGTNYYRDYDGDGVGSANSGFSMACTAEPYYSEVAGDCNDNDPAVSPQAIEVCDGKDNNCDGRVDENLPIQTYCVDADSDGHGVAGQQTVSGCAPPKGYGACDEDCNDSDPSIYPSAQELCNGRDDNCNGRVDENAKAVCGVGWCARSAEGCSSECIAGAPRAETCNAFDDDCDGVTDNGSSVELCGKAGFVCRAGACLPEADAGNAPSNGGAAPAAPADAAPPEKPGSASPGDASAPSETPPALDGAPAAAPTGHCAVGIPSARGSGAYAALFVIGYLVSRARRRRADCQRS